MSEMNDQVRAVVFIFLALLILFTWGHFFKPPVPPPQSTPAGAAQSAPGAGQASGANPSSSASSNSATTLSPGGKPSAIPTVQAAAEKTVTIESALYSVEFSNRGGVVRSWKLKKYFDDQKPPHPLDLVNADAAQQLGWPFSLLLSDPQLESQANSALYEVTTPAGSASENLQAPLTVTFHWSDGHLDVTKKMNV